jgi:tetratricopeptide (TPR) repeat protein
LRPEGKQAHVNLGMVRQELGDLKGARESYERALQITPDLPEVFYNLASILEQQGAKEEAEKYYAKLTAQRADSSEDAWFRLGYLRLQKGDFRGSIEAFQSCVRKRGDWPEAHVNLGIAHWRLGDRDQAIKVFEQVLALDPNSLDALRGLAALAVEREDFPRALDLQARLIEQGEKTPELFYNTGLLLQKAGRLDDAIRRYRDAIAQRPNFAEALLNLGHALKAKGNHEEARACWKQALDFKPELAQGYFDQAIH